MTREQKIQYLQMVEAGTIKAQSFKTLPEIVLNNTTEDVSDVLISRVQYPFYLYSGYSDHKTGEQYTPQQVAALIEKYGKYIAGCIPVISKKDEKLFCFHFIFRQIDSHEQTENFIQLQTDCGGIAQS